MRSTNKPPPGIKDPYGPGLSVDEAHAKYDTPAMRKHLGYSPDKDGGKKDPRDQKDKKGR